MATQTDTDANMARLQSYIDEQVKARPIEAKIVRRIFKALKAAGTPIVSVWDSEEDNEVKTLADVFLNVFNLDSAHLYTESGDWVYIIMGQEWDMIADYTISLEDALNPVNDWIMSKY